MLIWRVLARAGHAVTFLPVYILQRPGSEQRMQLQIVTAVYCFSQVVLLADNTCNCHSLLLLARVVYRVVF